MSETRSFPSSPQSIKPARQFVARYFLDASTADAATLMVSELATNCVRHAHSWFTVTVTPETSTTLRIEVRDHGEGVGSPRLCRPTPTEPSGRGLQIVAALAHDWGTSINESGGHTVWFTLMFEAPVTDDAVQELRDSNPVDRLSQPPIDTRLVGVRGAVNEPGLREAMHAARRCGHRPRSVGLIDPWRS